LPSSKPSELVHQLLYCLKITKWSMYLK
jgi:hypothetical protein